MSEIFRRDGVLERTGVRTYRSPLVGTTAHADLAALLLDCGGESFASGPSAAALHGTYQGGRGALSIT